MLKFKFLQFCALAVLLVTANWASADILASCAGDIKEHCSGVQSGEGRIAACLYSHEEKLSDGCDAAVAEILDVLDLFFFKLQEIHEQCGNDIRTHCGDVEKGEGRIYSCLQEKEKVGIISPGCQALVSRIQLPPSED